VRLARLKKIVDAIADGVSARTLKEELSRLEGRQDELRALLAKPEPERVLRWLRGLATIVVCTLITQSFERPKHMHTSAFSPIERTEPAHA
jgi:hypothetical protein